MLMYWTVVRIGWHLPALWAVHWHRRWWHGSVYIFYGSEGNCELLCQFELFLHIYNLLSLQFTACIISVIIIVLIILYVQFCLDCGFAETIWLNFTQAELDLYLVSSSQNWDVHDFAFYTLYVCLHYWNTKFAYFVFFLILLSSANS